MTHGLLSLVQWLSPAFPTGGFAYSHGMETVIAEGVVSDAKSLRLWLSDVLEFGSGRQDAILLAAALKPGADLTALDALACALQPSSERLRETIDQGTAFARTVSAVTGRDLVPRSLPLAVAEAAYPLGLPVDQVLGLYLHAFASNLVSVAMRFMPLGQEAGQAVLSSLHPVIHGLASRAADWGIDDLAAMALGSDMASMRHETMDVRIFRT